MTTSDLRRRLRLAGCFAALLGALAAVPALAAEPSTLSSEDVSLPPKSLEAHGDWVPDGDTVREGIAEAIRGEEARERELRTPAAAQERIDSRDAFASVDASGAVALLRAKFGRQLETINSDPARSLSRADSVRVLSDTAATVTEDGHGTLLDAGTSLKAEDEAGRMRPLDLNLERDAGGGLETANARSDVRLGEFADDAIEVGEKGVSISQVGVRTTSPTRQFGDQNAFQFETLTDTDTLISPTAFGVEIFDMLRSAKSPERLRFKVTMPKGAELRADGNGGALVADGSKAIALIPAPTAVDAQGTDVPVGLTVEGNNLLLSVNHRDGDYAMPILVDPIIEDWANKNWYSGYNTNALENGAWQYASEPSGLIYVGTGKPCYYTCWGVRGLYLTAPSRNYGANVHSQWVYSAPNEGSYIEGAYIPFFWRDNHGCSPALYNEPHDYIGWVGNHGEWLVAPWLNQSMVGGVSLPGALGRAFVYGLGTGSSGVNIPCWRDVDIGAIAITLGDSQNPTIDSISGVPGGWINDSTQLSVDIDSGDAGLGVQFDTVTQSGKGEIDKEFVGCTGLYGSRCPTDHVSHLSFTADSLGEGIRTLLASAQDPTGKGSASYEQQTMVDRSKPEVTLSGQLAEETNEGGTQEHPPGEGDELALPVYNLTIAATDGDPGGEAKDKRSGVRDISLSIDEEELEVPWTAQSCGGPDYSCPMNENYPLVLTGLEAGEHTLEVLVCDQVENCRERKIEFEYLPATGMTESYALQYFPLAAAESEEGEEGGARPPELAVNVMNGNLVYRETDIDVEGSAAVDLEVERYYNSQLPDSESSEWGEGWTLAQTPELEPAEGSPPDEADLLEPSGALADGVDLPTEPEAPAFNPELQASLEKIDGGGYELTDETGEAATSVIFGEDGRTEERSTEGDVAIDYEYEGGTLSGIDVNDPGSAGGPTEDPEESESEEEPQLQNPTPVFNSTVGSHGSADGQLSQPGGLAVGADGNIWIADTGNQRIQEFSPNGEFLSKFGSNGVGNGQFAAPAGIAIDSQSDVWVTDAESDRVQKFNSEGEYLDGFGSTGSSAGELDSPEGIAVDEEGDLWIADRANGRVQEFSPEGEFLRAIGAEGSGEGELGEPTAVDIGPEGNVWVADWQSQRISVFDREGALIRQFGTEGSGDGELDRPAAVDVDERGNVWVADKENERVQRFDLRGEYVDQFGSAGTGEGQLDFARPMGILATASGEIWLSDSLNHRLQHWVLPEAEALEGEALPDDDPEVEVDVSGGLVTRVEGEEAGVHEYQHEGDDLVAHEGPEGTTEYEYDEAGRMTKVTLADETYAEIAYQPTIGRVASVTIALEGANPETTYFEYSDEPRYTIARRPTVPALRYDIGDDGSIFKSHSAQEPPELALAGTLYDHREEDGALFAGSSLLEVQAFSAEGISSIEVIAGGDTLVKEKHCAQDPETPGTECENEKAEWIAETSAFPPGHVYVEAIVTDGNHQSSSERFWVDMPEDPPLAPGTPVPPRFSDIAKFREERGLEINFPIADETEFNERILDLITAWWNPQTPKGEVARASYERWGVPLRAVDVAELEYRQWFLEVNGALIEDWAESTGSTTYAGYYLDSKAGGLLRVGFTESQQASLDQLNEILPLVATDRLAAYPTPPAYSLKELQDTAEVLTDYAEADAGFAALVNLVSVDAEHNSVTVGTEDVSGTEAATVELLGSASPVVVRFVPDQPRLSGRFRTTGRMRAGDWWTTGPAECTVGFGAHHSVKQPSTGKWVNAQFFLTAGHCGNKGEPAKRADNRDGLNEQQVGHIARDGWVQAPEEPTSLDPLKAQTDAAAVLLTVPKIAPRRIIGLNGDAGLEVRPAVRPRIGNEVCFSGATSQNPPRCGRITEATPYYRNQDWERPSGGYIVEFDGPGGQPGDSGAPVWVVGNKGSVGLLVAPVLKLGYNYTLVEPLLHPRQIKKQSRVPGILHDPIIAPITLKTAAGLRG